MMDWWEKHKNTLPHEGNETDEEKFRRRVTEVLNMHHSAIEELNFQMKGEFEKLRNMIVSISP